MDHKNMTAELTKVSFVGWIHKENVVLVLQRLNDSSRSKSFLAVLTHCLTGEQQHTISEQSHYGSWLVHESIFIILAVIINYNCK